MLFCLFIDPIIRHLRTLLPPKRQHLYTFIDILAPQSSDPKTLHTVSYFLFHTGPKYSSVHNTSPWSLILFPGFEPALVSYCEPGRRSEASSVSIHAGPKP